ncbi:heavy-metal-associated domain-containing protein [Nibrella saemangeumensis]
METTTQSPIRLKTNIKCGGCIATVTPFLNEAVGPDNWRVDTASPDKVLTVEATDVSPEQVQQAVQRAGYKAERLS